MAIFKRKFTHFIALFLVLFTSQALASQLTSIVDRTEIGIDETLELKVRYTGNRAHGQPNFSELESQFEILSTSQSNQFSSINGQVTSYTDWQLILSPLKEGNLLIPSFKFANAISDAVQIKVTPAAQAPAGQLNDIFVETEIDKTDVYVQEQIKVTYRLFYSVNVDSLDTQPLELENVIKEQLPDKRFSRRIQGKLYRVAEFSFALYPQTSEALEIPSLTWNIRVPKGEARQSIFGLPGRYEQKRLRTDAKSINVKQRPAAFPAGAAWLPAESFNIQEQWSKSVDKFNLGEPITRTITMRATGVMAEQLPNVWGNLQSEGITSYADQPDLNNNFTEAGATSTRIESAAVVITKPGSWNLPAIRIPWWNTRTDTLEYAEIPAKMIASVEQERPARNDSTVNNSALASDSDSALSTSSSTMANTETLAALQKEIKTWKTISAILLIISFALIGFTWWQRKSSNGPPTSQTTSPSKREQYAFNALERACLNQDAKKIRQSLLEWAQLYFGQHIKTLDDIAKHGSDDLSLVLKQLDASLYGSNNTNKQSDMGKNSNAFDGGALASLLNQLRINRKKAEAKNTLEPLYPTA